MRFPLRDWIDAHRDARFDLASSGMRGSIAAPRWPQRRPNPEAGEELASELADHLAVDRRRLFLAHGASEANGWVLGFLARDARPAGRTARVQLPEYPPLFEAARCLGFRVRSDRAPAGLAIVSRPRNPEGDLWPPRQLDRFGRDARQLVVDETFREFARVPSVAAAGLPGRWATGTFTKFFGGDDVRVGWAVAPPEAVDPFARYVGLLSDELAPASAAAALDLLRNLPAVRRAVRRVVEPNRRALRAAFPGSRDVVAPLWFDRRDGESGRQLAERCLADSILVCPGDLFGDPTGVRLTLTRRDFPASLRAYRAVRDGRRAGSARRPGVRPLDRPG